jgi:hypothetical protein
LNVNELGGAAFTRWERISARKHLLLADLLRDPRKGKEIIGVYIGGESTTADLELGAFW